MKKVLSVIFSVLLLISLASCSNKTNVAKLETTEAIETTVLETTKIVETTKAEETIKVEETTKTEETINNNNNGVKNMGNPKIELSVKDYGIIQLELDPNEAPITVENFLNLVNKGFYDGLTFHRIIKGFMIQGGDPEGTGMGGSDKNIKGEFTSNGVENNIKHVRGVISMARSMNPDSASSQFFIMHEDAPHLDGNYAAFGHVTSGIEVVDKICDNTPVQDGNGSVAKNDQPIIEYIKVIE